MSIDTSSRVITRTTAALEAGIPYILHQGGTSSGKTFGILYSLLYYSLKYLSKNDIVSVTAQTLPHLKKGAINDFERILSLTKISGSVERNKSDHTYFLPNKTCIQFYAPDDEEKAKSGKRKLLFMNEADSIAYSIANQLMLRTDGPIILDWNPSGKFWLHKVLLKALPKEDYLFTKTTYRDNKYASEKIIKEIERLRLIDPSKYDIYGLGEEGKGTEIIYPTYELVDFFPEHGRAARGLDFGFTNHESAGIRGNYFDGKLWFDELFYEKGLSNKQIAERFNLHPDQRGIITGDSAEPKSIKELEDYGLPIKGAIKGSDSVYYGIQKIKEYPLMITKRSTHLIDELDGYKWIMVDGQPSNKPVNKNDHLMAAMRYCIQGIFSESATIRPLVRDARKMGFTSYGI